MKKFTAILLTVIMVASLFISCNNSIAPTITDETVSVSFSEATSRSLTASVNQFDANDYYWAYKATKKDNTGLISGETKFAWVKTGNVVPGEGDKGLAGVKIPGFSQGTWEFILYAYSEEGRNSTSYHGKGLAYRGETITTLQKGATNTINVTVNPNTQGNGQLIVNVDNITIIPQKNNSIFSQGNFTKIVTVTKVSDDAVQTGENNTFTLATGAYKVTVDIVKDNIIYASGSVVATVYPYTITTVYGALEEYIVPAQFDPAINPDFMNKVVYSDSISSNSREDVVINKKSETETETDSKVTATIPIGVANAELINAINENKDSAGATTDNTTIAFSLTVNTTKAQPTWLNLEIGMNAVIKVTKGMEIKQISKGISSLNDYVTVEINLQTALQNVEVTHDGKTMQQLTSLDKNVDPITNENGAYYYDAVTGLLTIKTKRFSPYSITYDLPPAESYVAEMNGVKYTSVQAAINAAPYNAGDSVSKITLLNNVTAGPSFGFPDPDPKRPEDIGKNILLDLNGKIYTFKSPAMGSVGYESQAMHLAKDNTLVVKNGTLSVANDNNEIKMLIQNYSNLTLENVIVDGTNLLGNNRYTMSNNNGNVVIKDSTIIAKYNGVAFDVCRYASYKGPKVTVEGNSVINGDVEISSSGEKEGAVHELVIKGGIFNGRIIKENSPNFVTNISGGTFVTNPAEFVDQTRYGIVSENGTYTISEKWATYGNIDWYNDIDSSFTISSAEQLAGFANLVSGGNNFNGKIVKLGADIDLAGKLWVPIGMKVTETDSSQPTASSKSFNGTFDGQNHTISNMRIDQWYATNGKGNTMYGIGLFNVMNGTLKNLTVKDSIVKATDGSPMQGNIFGIVAGYSYGTVTYENVHVINCNLATGDICAFGKVGGILGMAADASGTTTFKKCSVKNTTIAGVYNCAPFAGLAQNTVSINNCTTENVIWKAGDSPYHYKNIDTIASKGTIVQGTYWSYSGDLYAAWSDYYNDYGNVENETITLNGIKYGYDGYCHNTIPSSSNE